MVKPKAAPPLDAVFGALSDPTRRRIIEMLSRGECGAGELAAPFAMSRPAISKHLAVLEEAKLIRRERDGRHQRVTLDPRPIRAAAAWITRQRAFWEGHLDKLARHLESPESKP